MAVWRPIAPLVGPVLNWLQKAVVTAFAALSYAAANWRTLLTYSLVAVAFGIVRFAGQAKHFLLKVIPGYLIWFKDNWRDIFVTIARGVLVMAKNIWTNLKSLWKSIKGMFSGKGWKFEWTNLLEGFESAVKELPKIADREIGTLEKGLSDRLGDQLQQDWAEHRKKYTTQPIAELALTEPPATAKKAEAAAAAGDRIADLMKGIQGATAGVEKAVAKITATGTFSGQALWGMAAGETRIQERTAKATEDTAKGVKRLNDKASSGGLTFTS